MSLATEIDGVITHFKEISHNEAECLAKRDDEYIFKHNSQIHSIREVDIDRSARTVSFKFKGHTYSIKILDKVDILVEQLGFTNVDQVNNNLVMAPMPGLVLDVLVEEGSIVAEGDPLLILEAMKMENVIKSPVQGTIKSIQIKKSNSVEKHQLLIELEI